MVYSSHRLQKPWHKLILKSFEDWPREVNPSKVRNPMKSRSSQILGIDSFPTSIWSFPHEVKGFPKFLHKGLGFPPQGLSVVKTVHTQIYSRLVVQGTSCSKSSALWKVLLSAASLSWTQQVNQLGIENLLMLYKKVVGLIGNYLISDSWLLISTLPFEPRSVIFCLQDQLTVAFTWSYAVGPSGWYTLGNSFNIHWSQNTWKTHPHKC